MKNVLQGVPKWIFVFGALVLLAVTGWNLMFPSGTWRYKVTVTIQTPEGLKTGYAVREMHVVHVPNILPEVHSSIDIRGEAVVIDLGKRGVVYAVMGTDEQYTLFNAFLLDGATTPSGIRYYKSLKPGTSVSLDWKHRPMLVTFKNPADPQTVESVYHVTTKISPPHDDSDYVVSDTLEKTFGVGVHLKDVTVEITDERVTENIKKKLIWLNELQQTKSRLSGNNSIAITTNNLSDNLASGSFNRGK